MPNCKFCDDTGIIWTGIPDGTGSFNGAECDTCDCVYQKMIDEHCSGDFETRLRVFVMNLTNRLPDYEGEAAQLAQMNQSDEAYSDSMFESLGGAIRGFLRAELQRFSRGAT